MNVLGVTSVPLAESLVPALGVDLLALLQQRSQICIAYVGSDALVDAAACFPGERVQTRLGRRSGGAASALRRPGPRWRRLRACLLCRTVVCTRAPLPAHRPHPAPARGGQERCLSPAGPAVVPPGAGGRRVPDRLDRQ